MQPKIGDTVTAWNEQRSKHETAELLGVVKHYSSFIYRVRFDDREALAMVIWIGDTAHLYTHNGLHITRKG